MSDSHGHEDHGVGHIVSPKILFATGTALIILTGITVFSAQFDFGEFNIWVALVIAGIKASLVCLFFMHLFWDRPFNSFVFIGSVAFVVLFIGFALTDSSEYRDDVYKGDGAKVITALQEAQVDAADLEAQGEAGSVSAH